MNKDYIEGWNAALAAAGQAAKDELIDQGPYQQPDVFESLCSRLSRLNLRAEIKTSLYFEERDY